MVTDSPDSASRDVHRAEQVWQPLSHPLEEDESVIDGFLELACSPAIQHAGRNKEYALHVLHNTGGSVKVNVQVHKLWGQFWLYNIGCGTFFHGPLYSV